MKKRIFNLTILILANYFSYSQSSVLGRVIYDISYVHDLQNPSHLYKDQMVLQFNKTASVYRSQLLIETTELEKKRFAELARKSGGNTIIDDGPGLMQGTTQRYYNFYDTKMNFQFWPAGGTYFAIKEPLEKIDWKIENVVRGIGGYGCQKAVGKSHGRTYIAWFTTEIPYPYGPRKLWGLPGMILEANDTENQLIYKLNKVDLKPMPEEKIEMPKQVVITTKKENERMQKASAKGAGSNTGKETYNAPNGATLTVTNTSGSHGAVSTTNAAYNNPIDRD